MGGGPVLMMAAQPYVPGNRVSSRSMALGAENLRFEIHLPESTAVDVGAAHGQVVPLPLLGKPGVMTFPTSLPTAPFSMFSYSPAATPKPQSGSLLAWLPPRAIPVS